MFSDEPTARSDESSSRRRPTRLHLRAGETLGRYEIVGELGAGTGGTVFEARDPQLDRPVALKVLSLHGRRAERRAARLLREGRALARLTHPNVVTVLDVGRQGSLLWVAMERIDGVTLTRYLQEQRPSSRGIVELFEQAGRGLAEAHRCGLVHRDFKPDNVMVEHSGRVVVMDFGLSRASFDSQNSGVEGIVTAVPAGEAAIPEPDGRLTRDGAILGTPFYMAPEQHLGQTASPAADQFSFCVALYEALFGRYPFEGEKVSAYALEVVGGRVVVPDLVGTPRRVWRVIERGLSTKADARWSSMDELLTRLRSSSGRRRLLLPAALGAALLGLWGSTTLDRWEQPAGQEDQALTCTSEAAGLRALWNASLRDELRQVAVGTAGPAVGRQAETWVLEHDRVAARVCEAPPSPQAIECLQHAAIEFRALLRASISHHDEVGDHWWWAFEQLPDAKRCEHTKTRTLMLPPDADVRAHIEARAQLVVAEVLNQRWKHVEGGALAREQVAMARRSGDAELELRALQAVAAASVGLGELDEAIETWAEVHTRAEQAGLDELATEAALEIASRELFRRKAEPGEHWIRVAESLLPRIDRPDLQAQATSERARLHQLRGDLEKAIVLAERSTTTESLSITRPLAHGRLRSNLAQILATAGRAEEATEILGQVLRTREQLVGFEDPNLAPLLINRGVLYRTAGRNDDVAQDLERAIHLLRTAGRPVHTYTATALLNRGVLASDRGNIDEAIGWLQESLVVHEKLYGPDHARVGLISVNIGALELQRENYDAAREHIERGLALYESNLSRNHHEFGQALLAKATLLEKQGQRARAHAAYQRIVDDEQIETPMWRLGAHIGLAETTTSSEDKKHHLQLVLQDPGFETLFGGERARVLFGLAQLESNDTRATELARRALQAAKSESTARIDAMIEPIESFLSSKRG